MPTIAGSGWASLSFSGNAYPQLYNVFWPLPQPDSVGPIIGADDVRERMRYIIEKWSPYYISILSQRLEAAGLIGADSPNDAPLPMFGSWVNQPEFRTYGTGISPTFLVTVPEVVGKPCLQGNGLYIAVYRAQVVVQVFGTNWEEAADTVSWYEKVIRWSVLQNRSLEQFAMSTAWDAVTYRGDEHDGTRTVAQAVMYFNVQVRDVISVNFPVGAVPFPPDPPPQDPQVERTVVTFDKFVVDEVLT
jgi:hypothetical protein